MMEHAVPKKERMKDMKLEELLKDSPDALTALMNAIAKVNEGEADKLKHVRFADLSEGGYVSKDKYTSLETDFAGQKEQLAQAQELIDQLKKDTGKDESLQQKITEYEGTISALKKENENLKLENALKFALKEAGAEDVDYLIFKMQKKEEIKLGEDGKIQGMDALISQLKTQLPNHFTAGNGGNGRKIFKPNPLPGGDDNKTVTKEQFLKMGYEERLRLKQSNPELFKKLTQ